MTGPCDIRSFNKLNLKEVSRHSERGAIGCESWTYLHHRRISVELYAETEQTHSKNKDAKC